MVYLDKNSAFISEINILSNSLSATNLFHIPLKDQSLFFNSNDNTAYVCYEYK